MKGFAGGLTQNDDVGGTVIMDLLQGSVDPMQYALLEPERLHLSGIARQTHKLNVKHGPKIEMIFSTNTYKV